MKQLITLAFCLAPLITSNAQEKGARPPAPPVTISTTEAGVRFAALGQVGQSRVEVYDASGRPVLDTGFLAGNVRDWNLKDSHGAALADGSYTCVVTIRELSGRLSFKQGVLAVNSGRAAVALGEAAQSEVEVEKGKSLTATQTQESAPTALTLTAHDGRAGQLVSTRGALSFRLGDFFAGKDREAMRLTEKGLTVAGALRAKGGILFDDGTALTSAGAAARVSAVGGVEPYAAGTGTVNRLAKWAETGGAGTLTDSAVTDADGRVGIGTASPSQALHVIGKGLFQNAATAAVFIADRTDGKIAAVGAGGASSTFAYDQTGIFKIESNSRASIAQGLFGADRGATTRLLIDGSGDVTITTAGQGLILKAANGTVCTKLTINNVGALNTNTVPCP